MKRSSQFLQKGITIHQDISIPSSPIAHLNGAISCSGPYIQSVRQAITEAQYKMDIIDKEIARLLQRREGLRKFCESHSPYVQLPPILQLPSELLAEIFLVYHWDATPDITFGVPLDQTDTLSGVSGPLLLSHVCSYWRSVAFYTPQLWTRITLNTANGQSKSRLEFLNLWLERSNPLPLSVHIINVRQLGIKSSTFDSVMERLISSSGRWEALHLITPSPDSWTLFARMKGRIPILKTCIITEGSRNQSQGTHGVPPVELLESAPQLRTIRMQNGPLLSVMAVPFHQLTTVDLVNDPRTSVALSVGECLKILRLCLKLKRCSLYCEGQKWASFSEDETTPVVHNELENICILSEVDGEMLGPFFKHLSCPSLRRLFVKSQSYNLDGDSYWNRYDSFTGFLTRTCGSLESLRLIVMEVGGEDIINHLHLTPQLRELELRVNESSGTKAISDFNRHRPPHLSDIRWFRRPNNFSTLFSQAVIASARFLTAHEASIAKSL